MQGYNRLGARGYNGGGAKKLKFEGCKVQKVLIKQRCTFFLLLLFLFLQKTAKKKESYVETTYRR